MATVVAERVGTYQFKTIAVTFGHRYTYRVLTHRVNFILHECKYNGLNNYTELNCIILPKKFVIIQKSTYFCRVRKRLSPSLTDCLHYAEHLSPSETCKQKTLN